jgi:SOS-response transcriptional repressor LexA
VSFVEKIRSRPGHGKQGRVTDEQLVAAIRGHMEVHGLPPTVRELGAAVGMTSPASVHYRLGKLAAAGKVKAIGSSSTRYVAADFSGVSV